MRVFARYVATLDPDSEIPSVDLLTARRPRVAPYIYSPEEITALMHAAGQLTPPLRAASYRTVIGLMATTGLRLGEALGLDRHDVDLADGALHVRAGKPKQREVPLHPTATSALRQLCAPARPPLAAVRSRRRSSSTPREIDSPSRSSTTTSRS